MEGRESYPLKGKTLSPLEVVEETFKKQKKQVGRLASFSLEEEYVEGGKKLQRAVDDVIDVGK